MTRKQIQARIRSAREAVMREISGNASLGGPFASAMSGEGYAGGYKAALDDFSLILNGVEPQDDRGYWRAAAHARAEGGK